MTTPQQFAEFIRAENQRIGTLDAGKPQFADRPRHRIRITLHARRQRHGRIARQVANPVDAGGGVAVEYRAVLGKCDLAHGFLDGRPVAVERAALDVVDGAA